jgi:4'-phosphopantetheinyl transferase
MEAESTLTEVFFVPVESACASAVQLLSSAERMRLSELRIEAARNEFVSLRACLRSVMSERLGCAPQSVVIEASPGCQPVAPGSGWYFSLSHASKCGVVALSRTGPIGVDIEADHHVQDSMLVARKVLHPSECEWICSQNIDTRSAAFLRLWVRKEAVAKASGQGLAMSLHSWSVLAASNEVEPCVDLELHGRAWRVHGLAGPAGHFVGLATGRADAKVELRHLPPGAVLRQHRKPSHLAARTSEPYSQNSWNSSFSG